MTALVVEGLQAGYDSALIVRGVHFTVASGEALAVIGRNGMGKTTTLKAILGYLSNSRGSVRVEGVEVHGQPPYRVVRRGLAYAPQEGGVFAGLTVRDNIESTGASIRRLDGRLQRVYEYFPVLGTRLNQLAGTLSGGEQKMLILAMALIRQPQILVIDEISDGLQPSMVSMVRDALLEERRTRGTSILLVEQNIDLAFSVADRVAVMKLGSLSFECTAEPASRDRVLAELAP